MKLLIISPILLLFSCSKYQDCVRCEHRKFTESGTEVFDSEYPRTQDYCTDDEKESIRYGAKSHTRRLVNGNYIDERCWIF